MTADNNNNQSGVTVTVLIVDDDRHNLALLERRLENENYIVDCAGSGEQALNLLDVQHYDCVLLDLNMPGMTGDEVLADMSRSGLLEQTRVIVVSAVNEKDRVIKCLELGAAGYVLKPVNMATLKSKMWQLLSGGKHLAWNQEPATELSGRILVIEDNDLNRRLLASRLEKMGLNVDTAEDGDSGLAMCKLARYDVVVLDLNLPGKHGLTVLNEMKSSPRLSKLPVVVVSGVTESNEIDTCRTLGVTEFLCKPYDPGTLKAAITKALEERPDIGEELWTPLN